MLTGILAGLATGALWGLTFVGPRAVVPFSTWDLTVARYGLFGVASAALMLHRRFRPAGLRGGRLLRGLLLGAFGYVGYFVSVAYAVRLAGAAIPPLVIGTMPVVLALLANLRDRTVPWRALAGPLSLIAAGVAVVNVAAARSDAVVQGDGLWLGVLCSVAALVVWVVYGLVNSAVMRAADAPDALQWTGLQGIGAALGSAVLLPATSFAGGGFAEADWLNFAAWALLLGIAGSWFATWFWVIASRTLPLALSAQLIVSETVFGLIGGFWFEDRWPTPAEWTGSAMQLAGVAAGVALLSRPARVTEPAAS